MNQNERASFKDNLLDNVNEQEGEIRSKTITTSSRKRVSTQRIRQGYENQSMLMQIQKPSPNYDPFKCPPDLLEAVEHGQSQRVCKPKIYIKDGKVMGSLSFNYSSPQWTPNPSNDTPKQQSDFTGYSKNMLEERLKSESQSSSNENLPKAINQEFLYKSISCFEPNIINSLQNIPQQEQLAHALSESDKDKILNSKRCPCCGFEINNEQLPLNCNNREFLHLGMTYPLYFDFIKQCALLLIVHFLCSSIPSIIINLRSDQCAQLSEGSLICQLSFLNILQKDYSDDNRYHKYALFFENLCNMIFLLISMIMISIFKIQQKIKKQKLDKYHCSISDFSIFLSNLPQQFTMEELHEFLKAKLLLRYPSLSPDIDLEVVKEYKLYDLREYASLYQHKIKIINKKLKKNKIQKKLMKDHSEYVQKIADPENVGNLESQNINDGKQQKSMRINSSIKELSASKEKSNNQTLLNSINENENMEVQSSAFEKQIIQSLVEELDKNQENEVLHKEEDNEIKNLTLEIQCDPSSNDTESLNKPLTINEKKKIRLEINEKKHNENKLSDVVKKLAQLGTEQNILSEEIQKTNKRLADFEETMANSSPHSQREIKFSKRVIITFNNYELAKQIRRSFKMTFKERYLFFIHALFPSLFKQTFVHYSFKDTFVKVHRAPEPTDVLWTNIGSTRGKYKYYFVSYGVTYLLISISFVFLLLLKKGIKKEQNEQSSFVSLLLSFCASTIVALFNTLLGMVIRWGARYEEHNVQTKFFVSVGKKLTQMFILNMVVSTLMSNTVSYILSKSKEFPLDALGLMNDFFFLFITNSYIGSIFNIFDIVWGVRLYQRNRVEKESSTITQMEANSLFEGHPIDMALRYANINKTVLFTASVSPFIPIGVPLSIIGLVITYWVDKYLLLRRYVCKNYLSFTLAKSMLNSFKIYSVYFSFGNMITMLMPVSYQRRQNQGEDHFGWGGTERTVYFYFAIFGFLMTLMFRYSPFMGLYDIYNCIFKEKYKKKQINSNYLDIKDDLADDYDFYHPIFKDKEKESKIRENDTDKQDEQQDKIFHNSDSYYQQMFKSIKNQVDFRSRN